MAETRFSAVVIFRNLVTKRHALSPFEIKYFPTSISDCLHYIEREEWATLNVILKVEAFRLAVRFDNICG